MLASVPMATLNIRNVPEDVVATLKARAKRNGRSLNTEVVRTLSEAAERRSVDEILDEIDQIRATIKNPPTGEQIDTWIRESREERGKHLLDVALRPRDSD
jgi:plasmid stability protein